MEYLESLRGLIRKTRILRRYILNVRKLPVRLPMFISTLTEAQNDAINELEIIAIIYIKMRRLQLKW